MLNKVSLKGRFARDPVLGVLPSGRPVAEVVLVNSRPYSILQRAESKVQKARAPDPHFTLQQDKRPK